jgi:AcrR family transcriptional regulator
MAPLALVGARPHIDEMPRKPDPATRVIDVALTLAARKGWRAVSLAAVADEAGIGVLQLYSLYRSKAAILDAFHRRIDAAALAGADAEEGERPRDRLFDVIMRRFDALNPHKDAVAAITRDAAADPLAALCGLPALLNSMSWMLEVAGVSASGWIGRARAKLLLALYLSVLRVWLSDDSADMARTMAALDSRLRHAEGWLGLATEAGGEAEAATSSS